MTKKPIIILSSFVAILFVAVLYLLYLNIQKPVNTIVEKLTPTSFPTQVTDPTVDWKTYKDSDNQYSFQYPTSYFADDKDIPKYLFVMLKGSDYKIKASDYGDKNTGSYYTFGINTACEPTDIVGNRQVLLSTSGYTVFSIKGYEGPDYKTALFNKNGLCYEMTCNSETGCVDKQFDDFKTILSTFKFTDTISQNNWIQSSNGDYQSASGCLKLNTSKANDNGSLEEYVKRLYQVTSLDSLLNPQKYAVNGRETITISPQGVGELFTVYFPKDDKKYSITFSVTSLDNILDTAKCQNYLQDINYVLNNPDKFLL